MSGVALQVVAVAIFALTLAAVITAPKGLSIGWSATAGAAVALAAGVVSLQNVATVWGIVWNATFTFVALIVLSIVLDRIGFFEWAALHVLHAARGNTLRAFVYVILLGALVAAAFANDGAALIITPIVYQQVRLLGFSRSQALPFVMGAGFIADTTSLPLVVSNLVNIVSANFFHTGFITYTATMLPVDLVSLAASLAVLLLYYRRSLPASYDHGALPPPLAAVKEASLLRAGWWVLGLLLAGYMLSEPLGVPVSVPAGAAAVVLLALAQRSGLVKAAKVLREAPWKIVAFSLGMYVVVFGLRNAGLTHALAGALGASSHQGLVSLALASGVGAALLSAVMNNMPTVLVGALSISGAHLGVAGRSVAEYANVVGCDLGPKFTPIGSLATLLWLHVLESKGVRISWATYMRTGLVLTFPVLLVTLLALVAWVSLVHP